MFAFIAISVIFTWVLVASCFNTVLKMLKEIDDKLNRKIDNEKHRED